MSELSAEEDMKLNKSQSSGSLHDPGNKVCFRSCYILYYNCILI